MSRFGIPRAFHPESILKLPIVEVINNHRKDIADLALGRERDLRIGPRLSLVEENQRARSGMGRENREIHASRHMARPEGKSMAIAHAKAAILMSVVKNGSDHQCSLARTMPNSEKINRFSTECTIPLTVQGG